MAMRRMKSMKAKKAMKAKKSMRRMKRAKKVSIIGRGKMGKALVFRGLRHHTVGGLQKDSLKKSKTGKIVSKKASAVATRRFKNSKASKWCAAVSKARKTLRVTGFCAVGGKTKAGQELLKRAR